MQSDSTTPAIDRAVLVMDEAITLIAELRAERDSLKFNLAGLQDAYTETFDALHDLCSDESERRAIGGGPGWKERHAATWARAFEITNPEA